jgi:hypothetical protein
VTHSTRASHMIRVRLELFDTTVTAVTIVVRIAALAVQCDSPRFERTPTTLLSYEAHG